MEVSYRLHVAGDQPKRDAVLPELPGSTTYEPGMLDRIGEQFNDRSPMLLGAGIGGGALGAHLLRRGGGGIFRGLAGGIVGALAGVALGATGLALLHGIGDHRAPASVREGTVAQSEVREREHVKVMTYNLHGGMGGPEKFGSSGEELDRLAEVIRREDPDVLILQESDNAATRSNYVDTLDQLSKRLHPDSAVGGTAETTIVGREQDVAVMTFHGFRIQDARNIVHPDPRGGGSGVRFRAWLRDVKIAAGHVLGKDWATDPSVGYAVRNTLDTMIRTPKGNEVRVLGGHYEWPTAGVDHQQRQVGDVAGALDAWSGPTIWGADFNVQRATPEGRREQEIMANAGLHDAFETAGVPITQRVSNPELRNPEGGGIDRIYASEHAKVQGARVVREAGDASDHLPVVTDLELQPEQG